jgi:hypothetical protein
VDCGSPLPLLSEKRPACGIVEPPRWFPGIEHPPGVSDFFEISAFFAVKPDSVSTAENAKSAETLWGPVCRFQITSCGEDGLRCCRMSRLFARHLERVSSRLFQVAGRASRLGRARSPCEPDSILYRVVLLASVRPTQSVMECGSPLPLLSEKRAACGIVEPPRWAPGIEHPLRSATSLRSLRSLR